MKAEWWQSLGAWRWSDTGFSGRDVGGGVYSSITARVFFKYNSPAGDVCQSTGTTGFFVIGPHCSEDAEDGVVLMSVLGSFDPECRVYCRFPRKWGSRAWGNGDWSNILLIGVGFTDRGRGINPGDGTLIC
jgi:hypothetical protein